MRTAINKLETRGPIASVLFPRLAADNNRKESRGQCWMFPMITAWQHNHRKQTKIKPNELHNDVQKHECGLESKGRLGVRKHNSCNKKTDDELMAGQGTARTYHSPRAGRLEEEAVFWQCCCDSRIPGLLTANQRRPQGRQGPGVLAAQR
jgi:hypothetical protein